MASIDTSHLFSLIYLQEMLAYVTWNDTEHVLFLNFVSSYWNTVRIFVLNGRRAWLHYIKL